MTATEIVAIGTLLSVVIGVLLNARKERRDGVSQAVKDALAPSEAWRDLIAPMERRLNALELETGQLRERITLLEGYVTILQGQIRGLGAEPIPFEHVRTKITRPPQEDES